MSTTARGGYECFVRVLLGSAIMTCYVEYLVGLAAGIEIGDCNRLEKGRICDLNNYLDSEKKPVFCRGLFLSGVIARTMPKQWLAGRAVRRSRVNLLAKGQREAAKNFY